MTDANKTGSKQTDGQLIDEKRMNDMSVAPGEPDTAKQVSKDKLKDADRDEDNLEEGIEDSMDASDPPASIQP